MSNIGKPLDVTLKKNQVHRIREGAVLLRDKDLKGFSTKGEEGTLMRLREADGQYVATAYLGYQNQGLGWVLTRQEDESVDQSFFIRRIREALDRREAFFRQLETTDCFRVFNGAADGIGGLTIDYYGGYYLISWYSAGIFAYCPEILEALRDAPGIRGIYHKKRFGPRADDPLEDSWLWGERGDFPLAVRENGVQLLAHLDDGAMTGFFPDQRQVRLALMERWAAGRRVLNTFSYTGAFSVFARLGGALSTTSVDLANRSRPKTQEHFLINGIDPAEEEIIVDDVFDFFHYCVRKGRTFDLVIMDPPSFAKAGKKTFRVQKDYGRLVKEALPLLAAEGLLLVSTNSAQLSLTEFRPLVEGALRSAGRPGKLLESYGLPPDYPGHPGHPEGDYLKVLLYQVRGHRKR